MVKDNPYMPSGRRGLVEHDVVCSRLPRLRATYLTTYRLGDGGVGPKLDKGCFGSESPDMSLK